MKDTEEVNDILTKVLESNPPFIWRPADKLPYYPIYEGPFK